METEGNLQNCYVADERYMAHKWIHLHFHLPSFVSLWFKMWNPARVGEADSFLAFRCQMWRNCFSNIYTNFIMSHCTFASYYLAWLNELCVCVMILLNRIPPIPQPEPMRQVLCVWFVYHCILEPSRDGKQMNDPKTEGVTFFRALDAIMAHLRWHTRHWRKWGQTHRKNGYINMCVCIYIYKRYTYVLNMQVCVCVCVYACNVMGL